MTETGGGATSMVGPDEAKHYGSAGRLTANMEAKIVDPSSGEALLPGKEGELWLKGPNVMKGAALGLNFPVFYVSIVYPTAMRSKNFINGISRWHLCAFWFLFPRNS